MGINGFKDVGTLLLFLAPDKFIEILVFIHKNVFSSPQTVIRHLESLPNEAAARDRQSRCAWYLSFLIKVSRRKWLPPKCELKKQS